MKAVFLEGVGKAAVKEVPTPSLGVGDILVEMKACGLCGSDLEKIQGEYTAAPPIIGHEAVGAVSAVGEDVEGLEAGDRVFPHHHVPCYDCDYCRSGSETMCPDYRGHHLDPGGFSEFFRVPSWIVSHGGVLSLPTSMTFDEGAFIEPLACCIRALDRLQVDEGSEVLVAGGGPMGLLLVQLLPHYGARRVIVSEVSPYRLEFAGRLGAEVVMNPLEVEVPNEVYRLTGGRGVDIALLATGSSRALHQSVQSVRAGGRVGLVGIPEVGAVLEGIDALVTREVSLISSNAATERETRRAMQMIEEGSVQVEPMVTHHVPLSEFSRAVGVAREAESMKVIITP